MTGSPFDFIYEDSDDSIHIPLRGQKRRFDLDVLDMVPLVTLSQPNLIPRVSDYASSSPLKERKKATIGTQLKPKCRHESTELDIDSPSQRRAYKRSRTGPVPDVVVRQLHLDKADLLPVLDKFQGLQCVLPGSGEVLTLDKKSLGPLRCDVPVLMFFFDFANVSWLKFFELFREKNIKIIAVTPQYNYFNPQSFPIVLDKNGVVTKLMGIQSPVGGGIFPIPSIFMFDRYQKEVMRIMLGYDYNVFYGSNASNSLQKVLADTVDYTLGI